jgi:PAS domain S-box-containing protein
MNPPSNPRIGFAPYDVRFTFWALLSHALRQAAKERGVTLVPLAITSAAEPVVVLEQLLDHGVDAVIMAPPRTNQLACAPLVRRACALGIPLIALDSPFPSGDQTYVVRSDNAGGAARVAEHLIARMEGSGAVIHLHGPATTHSGRERAEAVRRVIANHPGVALVFEADCDWSRHAGADTMRRALAAHPGPRAVVAGNDQIALGAIDALGERGLVGQVLIAGFDAQAEALRAIERGLLTLTARQEPARMGRAALDLALQSLAGENPPAEVVTDVTLITAENLLDVVLETVDLLPGALEDLTESTSVQQQLQRETIDSQQRMIGELAQAAALLRESEERYRLITDHTSDLIGVYDQEGRVLYASPSHRQWLGREPSELLGMNGHDLIHPDDAEVMARLPQDLAAQGEARVTFRCAHADGTWRWLEASIVLASPEAEGYTISVARDVTRRKQLEAQLLHAQRMESIGRLAGGVAHDFNNLLTAISGYAELALAGLPAQHPIAADLTEIHKAAERATQLTSQLLAFARRQIMEPRVLSLNDLILETERLLRRLIGEDVELTTLPAPELWPVKVDPGQIEQVLVNLAVNARDAMPSGGRLTIETQNVVLDAAYARSHASVVPGPYVLLAISDTGAGMPPEVQAHAFEPFYTTKETGKGTGLGLATCYGIVKQHGGNIWVSSEPGQGATFTIYLPRADTLAEPPAHTTGPASAPGGSETVLLVEDNTAVRELAARVLRAQGYTVLEAAHGGDALRVAQGYTGDLQLLLTDAVMPEMGGRALAGQLMARYPNLRVLYISGYTDEAILRHGELNSGVALLQKPFTPAALARKVRDVLDAPRVI